MGVCVRSWAEFSSDRGLVDPQSSRLAKLAALFAQL